MLFTPNVPQTGAGVRGGGEWGYSLEMWRDLLERTGAVRGYSLQMPEVSSRQPIRRGLRRVVRD